MNRLFLLFFLDHCCAIHFHWMSVPKKRFLSVLFLFLLLPRDSGIAEPVSPLLAIKPTIADILFENGDSLDHLGLRATVVHTPGHSDGHCCLMVQDSLAFTGDLLLTLFGPG
ncbi:MAG: hypothetical protein JW768_12880, partial [Chitinispirillaceae bacterium]|nr:hypothetical protein [Chitinispirillaceae bacterium]